MQGDGGRYDCFLKEGEVRLRQFCVVC